MRPKQRIKRMRALHCRRPWECGVMIGKEHEEQEEDENKGTLHTI